MSAPKEVHKAGEDAYLDSPLNGTKRLHAAIDKAWDMAMERAAEIAESVGIEDYSDEMSDYSNGYDFAATDIAEAIRLAAKDEGNTP